MALPTPERRANPRIDIHGEMNYRIGDSGETRQGEIENISANGVFIWITEDLQTDSRLLIRIDPIDEAEEAMELRATLLYRLPDRKDSLHGYGCSLEIA